MNLYTLWLGKSLLKHISCSTKWATKIHQFSEEQIKPLKSFHVLFLHLSVPIIINLLLFIFTNPSARAGYDTKSIFKRSLTGLNSEFSFSQTSCLTKAEEPSLPYYLPIAGGGNDWIHTFPKGISKMQSVLARIWICVTVSISYNNNHYTINLCY